ncbi:MAG: hypothetical protein GY869_21955, partial [Planctomycetes bacterium]|nr:hypothetical protein [Planctomycetota bacterium]
GAVDLIYINEEGFITIGECKLWRNPEARRKVIGQILDYAKDISKWDYIRFQTACLKARKSTEKSLFQIMHNVYNEIEESVFIDNVQRNLEKGRFLLAVIGDGIRGNMEELTEFIHRNGNLNFTLGLIELPVFKNPIENELLITPRILVKTKEIERIIYRISDSTAEITDTEGQEEPASKSISERVFYERLEKVIGNEKVKQLEKYVETLTQELNIIPKLGRGKRLSLNLKSSNDSYNFGSIQETGEVWFYGIVNKTEEIGDRNIGVDYLKQLANIINGELDSTSKEWFWSVKREGKYLVIGEYLDIQSDWIKLISEVLEKVNRLEENE